MTIAILVGFAMAGCGTGVDPVVPENSDTIIPATTKVMDDAARGELAAIDARSLMFKGATPVLHALKPGDVVVSGPTPAAPHGFLRKVVSVQERGGSMVVETQPARLTDAVRKGRASLKRELTSKDLVSAKALQQGVTFNLLNVELDTDLGTGGKVRVTGSANIKPFIEADLGISVDGFEIPDLDARFRIGVEEHTNFSVTANAPYAFDKEVAIAEHEFAPITFSIAAVPIVLIPKMELYLRANGSLTASFDFSVEQDLLLAAGFEYNSDDGFKNLSEQNHSLNIDGPEFAGRVDVRATVGARFRLSLYDEDLAGVYASLEAGPALTASVNGLPPAGSLLWKLEGCLYLFVGAEVGVLDLRYEKELYRVCVPITERQNSAPSVEIVSPTPTTTIYVGVPVRLLGRVNEFDSSQQGDLTCRWTSSQPLDAFGSGLTNCEGHEVTFNTAGVRTIQLTSTDPLGARGSDSVTVNVQQPPAMLVRILSPVDGNTAGPGRVLQLSGTASGGVAPYTYTWKVASPTDRNGNGGLTYTIGIGQTIPWLPTSLIPFPPAQDDVDQYAKITLEVTDGRRQRQSMSVVVHFLQIAYTDEGPDSGMSTGIGD